MTKTPVNRKISRLRNRFIFLDGIKPGTNPVKINMNKRQFKHLIRGARINGTAHFRRVNLWLIALLFILYH
jgi:hypothetical protein